MHLLVFNLLQDILFGSPTAFFYLVLRAKEKNSRLQFHV